MANYYTMVGSRDITPYHYNALRVISRRMNVLGYVVRSGGADGADTAAYEGGFPNTEVYLPWEGFNGLTAKKGEHVNAKELDNYEKAKYMASMFHPAWDSLKDGAKALHTRNVYQVLGFNLDDPSLVLICCAPPNGKSVKGGTATAFEIAKHYKVPTYNIYEKSELRSILSLIGLMMEDIN